MDTKTVKSVGHNVIEVIKGSGALEQRRIAQAVRAVDARRLAACWNALQHVSTEQLETGELLSVSQRMVDAERQRDIAEAHIDWIERVNTLHRQVEILYVVDGYEATITWDGQPISEDFHGVTVAEAIDKAMASFDLSAPPKWVDGERLAQDPVDRQLAAVEKQRDALLAALEHLATVTTPDSNGQWGAEDEHAAALAKARDLLAAAKGGAQ